MQRGNANNIPIARSATSERHFPDRAPSIRVQRLGIISSNAAMRSLLEETHGYDAYDSALRYDPIRSLMTVLRHIKKPAA